MSVRLVFVGGYGEMKMIQIKRDSFYSRSELVKIFEEHGVDWDALSARMKVPRRHRLLFHGQDVFDSWMSLPDQRDHEDDKSEVGISNHRRSGKSDRTLSLAALVERKRVHGN